MTMRSGALARAAGVSTDTLRFYERRGLLPRPPRDANGYRRYPADALQRVVMIQRALDAGFTIADLQRIFRVRDSGGVPCRDVLTIASARLRELDDRIAALVDIRKRVGALVSSWRKTLDATPAGTRARLLEALATDNRRRPSMRRRKTSLRRPSD